MMLDAAVAARRCTDRLIYRGIMRKSWKYYAVFAEMTLNRVKALVTYIVLHAACVVYCRFLIDSETEQHLGEHCVALVDMLCGRFAACGKRYKAVFVYSNISAAAENTYRAAYRGL